MDDADPSGAEDDSYASELLGLLRALPAEGFERICQRLLRESGFEKVEITGRSGDGGIDGHGVLAVNPLVTKLLQARGLRHRPSEERKAGGEVAAEA